MPFDKFGKLIKYPGIQDDPEIIEEGSQQAPTPYTPEGYAGEDDRVMRAMANMQKQFDQPPVEDVPLAPEVYSAQEPTRFQRLRQMVRR